MTQRNNAVTKLQLKVVLGSDSNGKDTFATRSYTVNPELTDEAVLAIGTKLGTLQSLPVEAVTRQDHADLAEVH